MASAKDSLRPRESTARVWCALLTFALLPCHPDRGRGGKREGRREREKWRYIEREPDSRREGKRELELERPVLACLTRL